MSENVCERELGKASEVKILLHRSAQWPKKYFKNADIKMF